MDDNQNVERVIPVSAICSNGSQSYMCDLSIVLDILRCDSVKKGLFPFLTLKSQRFDRTLPWCLCCTSMSSQLRSC